MEKNKTIRILMVEDQPLCRLGIKMSLADTQLPCELLGVKSTNELILFAFRVGLVG